MKNLTPELIAKAKAAKSAEELWELAKANGVELTETEAKTCFAQLHTNGAVSDDELEAVAGGGAICEFFEDFFRSRNGLNESSCSHCGDKSSKPNKTNSPTFNSSITPLPFDSLPCDSNDQNKIDYL